MCGSLRDDRNRRVRWRNDPITALYRASAHNFFLYQWPAPGTVCLMAVPRWMSICLSYWKSLSPPRQERLFSPVPFYLFWSCCCVTAGPASLEWISLPFRASVYNVGETMVSWRRSPSLIMIHIDKKGADERTHKSGMKKKKIKGRANLDATVSSSSSSTSNGRRAHSKK